MTRSNQPETAPFPVDLQLREQVKELEQRFKALRDQARQAQRLASLGTAAAMLAHEFNNLMTPVVGYAKYALDHEDVPLTKKALEMTVRQAATLTAMADRILGLAVEEAQSYASVPVRVCVEEAVACLCRDLSKDGIGLTVDVAPDLTVWTDPRQLQQVLFNLLINARQALGEHGGSITFRAYPTEDECVTLEVRDTGCGIPAEMLDSIFEPFFTTKREAGGERHRGSGLGLAICKDIIEEQRGRIEVSSKLGIGTTFSITLPSSR